MSSNIIRINKYVLYMFHKNILIGYLYNIMFSSLFFNSSIKSAYVYSFKKYKRFKKCTLMSAMF